MSLLSPNVSRLVVAGIVVAGIVVYLSLAQCPLLYRIDKGTLYFKFHLNFQSLETVEETSLPHSLLGIERLKTQHCLSAAAVHTPMKTVQ